MSFRIIACDPAQFSRFFTMSDAALAQDGIHKVRVTASPGTPCRVSLAEAEVGETVLLLNYCHQPAATPFRSSHAIFVREGVERVDLEVGQVPAVLVSRLISLQAFDSADMMIEADVVEGSRLSEAIERVFQSPGVACIHLHFAKQGCFAARVQRA